MGEEKEILLHGKVCAYLTGRLMGDPLCFSELVVQIAVTEWTPDDHFAPRGICWNSAGQECAGCCARTWVGRMSNGRESRPPVQDKLPARTQPLTES